MIYLYLTIGTILGVLSIVYNGTYVANLGKLETFVLCFVIMLIVVFWPIVMFAAVCKSRKKS